MSISCRFVYRFKNKRTGRTSERVVTGINSKYEAYQTARKMMIDELDVSIRKFESEWMIDDKEVAIGVSKNIAYNSTRIKNELRSLEGVEKVDRVESKEHDDHMVYYIRTEELLNEDYIIDKVRNMFRNIDSVENQLSDEILVIINPPYFSK